MLANLMKQPSFLARKTLGQPNYLLIALAVTFCVAFVPRGVRQAIEGNTNKAEDWLPPNYPEAVDLNWFRDHFVGEQFALVSWKGCTLGDPEKLRWLEKKLIPTPDAVAKAGPDSKLAERARWYKKIVSGPGVLEQLTEPPLSLSYNAAAKRLEGALVGPLRYDEEGNSLGNEGRITCLMVYLSEEATRNNKTMRRAIEHIAEIAETDCGIAPEAIHMGGQPVDNITIDVEGEKTLFRLASLSGIVGLTLSYWCFRSMKLTGVVFTVGVISAGISLAIVFYFGVLEVRATGRAPPRLGTIDAILMSMPAVVYVLGLSGAIHIVNYYRDARRDDGLEGAAETAIRQGWAPCALAALTTAIGLGSLYSSDILPIKKFGLFTAIAVLATIGVLFTLLPVFLHRFPISDDLVERQSRSRQGSHLPGWARSLFGFVVRRHVLTCVVWFSVMGLFAYGMTRIETRVQLLKLLDEKTDLIGDYAWLESNLGNLVPMEIVLTIPCEMHRTPEQHAEEDGLRYRQTMLDRLNMIRTIQTRVEDLPEISRVLSVATFTPENTDSGSHGTNIGVDFEKINQLVEGRQLLLDGDYLRDEQAEGDSAGRELWRISARVAALGDDADGVDYGLFVQQLKKAVDPILVAYYQRDQIVAQLHKLGKQLEGARLCILYRAEGEQGIPSVDSQEWVLKNLLLQSGVQLLKDKQGVPSTKDFLFYNLAKLDANRNDPLYQDRLIGLLSEQDALILVSAGSDPTAKQLAAGGLNIFDVSDVPVIESTAARPLVRGENDSPRPIRAVYTGMVPLVYKTQRQLLISLNESILWATALIAVVMMFVLRSPIAGLLSMIPNVFPIVIVFGTLGWLGMKVDIGIMMTASVALGVAVDDTVHFLTWFRRGVSQGLDRVAATMLAYDRCATAMLQTTIIGGLGLAVFATSTFTPTQQFGYLMISMLAAALVGDLLLLPALLVSPLGSFFGGGARPDDVSGQPSAAVQQPAPNPAPTPDPSGSSPVASSPSQLADELQDLSEGQHAALHAKLRELRREHPHDPISS